MGAQGDKHPMIDVGFDLKRCHSYWKSTTYKIFVGRTKSLRHRRTLTFTLPLTRSHICIDLFFRSVRRVTHTWISPFLPFHMVC